MSGGCRSSLYTERQALVVGTASQHHIEQPRPPPRASQSPEPPGSSEAAGEGAPGGWTERLRRLPAGSVLERAVPVVLVDPAGGCRPNRWRYAVRVFQGIRMAPPRAGTPRPGARTLSDIAAKG